MSENIAADTPEFMTADEVGLVLRCSGWKVKKEARALGVGFNLGGRAGWRFDRSDIDKLRAAMTPTAPPARRRRRSA